jgi:hypothetical protein
MLQTQPCTKPAQPHAAPLPCATPTPLQCPALGLIPPHPHLPLHHRHATQIPTPIQGAPIAVNTCGCGELLAKDALGPNIRLSGFDPKNNTWRGSALLVLRASVTQAPTLTWSTSASTKGPVQTPAQPAGPTTVQGELLDSYLDWRTWRFALVIPVQQGEQRVDIDAMGHKTDFYVAGE